MAQALQAGARRARIMICEDHQDLLNDLAFVLEQEGYEVLAHLSADAARADLVQRRPDLILCDISMPGTDGMAFLQEIRADHPDLDEVPFLILSAYAEAEDVVMGKRAGADDYLVKPVDFDLLLATIEARLREVERLSRAAPAPLARAPVLPGASPANPGMMRAVERLDFGLVLLDGQGRVCFGNAAARDLADAQGLSLRKWLGACLGEVCLRDALEDLRAALATGAPFRRVVLANGDAVRGDGDEAPQMVIALSDLGGPAPGDAEAPVGMAMVLEDQQTGLGGTRLIGEASGLTATESEVAMLLARGERVPDVALALGISRTTVSYHLRNIFQKTATSRQADLVSLLRRLPLRDAGPEG